jgi:hypothetical protein
MTHPYPMRSFQRNNTLFPILARASTEIAEARARLSKKPLDGLGTSPAEALAKADQRRSSARREIAHDPKDRPATTTNALPRPSRPAPRS